jgi:multidrug efflux pump subunit AcrB
MFFLTGTVRYLFVPLAEAVVFAVFASYVLSRTLLPTLVMWFYRNVEHRDHDARRVALWLRPFAAVHTVFLWGFARLANAYGRWLGVVLQHRLAFAGAFVLFCAGTAMLLPQLGADFFPAVDAGQFRLHMRARSGTRIEETVKLTAKVETAIRREIPASEIAGVLNNIGFPSGGTTLTYVDNGAIGTGDADILVSLQAGHRPTEEYVRRLRLQLGREFPGVTFYFLPADIASQTINFGLPAPFDIQIVGKDQDSNRGIASRLAERLRRVPGVVDVRVQQPADLPRLQFAVDRTKASDLGLTERDVANSMLLGLSGSSQVRPVYWLNPRNGVQYLVNVRVPEHSMDSVAALEAMPMEGSHPGEGDAVLLANLATMQRTNVPPVVSHYNAKPVIDVLAGASGRDLAGVLRDIKPLIAEAEKELPRGSFISLRGQAETMNSSFIGLGIGLVMAVVLVYLLLVVNFQSWLDPFIIITALPGALAGVLWALYLTFTHLSVPALIGAIMSVGVATANSVLVVTFARNNLQKGVDPLSAAWEGATGRLRPVLMTALTTIIAMLPMALGLGEGGEQNAPLGRAVIGGLIVATFATLFFVPVVFRLLHPRPQAGMSEDLDAVVSPTAP